MCYETRGWMEMLLVLWVAGAVEEEAADSSIHLVTFSEGQSVGALQLSRKCLHAVDGFVVHFLFFFFSSGENAPILFSFAWLVPSIPCLQRKCVIPL